MHAQTRRQMECSRCCALRCSGMLEHKRRRCAMAGNEGMCIAACSSHVPNMCMDVLAMVVRKRRACAASGKLRSVSRISASIPVRESRWGVVVSGTLLTSWERKCGLVTHLLNLWTTPSHVGRTGQLPPGSYTTSNLRVEDVPSKHIVIG